jgi:hypothetical protein
MKTPMKSLWEHDARLEILRRIESVKAETAPLWGKMTCARMIRHLARAMSMASGELPVKPKNLPLRYFPLKQLAIYVLPFAKGLPTAPELLEGDCESLDAARADLRREVESFAARKDVTSWPDHPAFGKLTPRAWGVLTWRHIDHHLRQFGA